MRGTKARRELITRRSSALRGSSTRGTKTSKETYYQTIAREFFKRRGAPFFLSPKDVALIARWEKARVPLDAVLEGMEMAFANYRKGGRPAGALTLAFCEYQVGKALAGRREKRAGGTRKTTPRDAKRERLREEIRRFLGGVPPGLEALAESFAAARDVLDDPGAGEEGLEALDDTVDEALWRAAPEEEKARVRRDVLAGLSGKRTLDLDDVARMKLVKAMRERHKVPYLSLYYY